MPYITRGRHSKKKDYPGKAGESFPYLLFRPGEPDYWVFGYLYEAKSPNGEGLTILYLSSEDTSIETIQRLYKKRFRIENTYRHARTVKIRTSTRKLHLRWFFWSISVLLELLWEIISYIYEILSISQYSSRQKQINRLLKEYIFVLFSLPIQPFCKRKSLINGGDD